MTPRVPVRLLYFQAECPAYPTSTSSQQTQPGERAMPSDEYDDELEHVFHKVTTGGDPGHLGDDELEHVFHKVTTGGDPGHLGDDEPEVRPLCRRCVADLPAGEDGLCPLCGSWVAGQ